jgi:hypothetical protein
VEGDTFYILSHVESVLAATLAGKTWALCVLTEGEVDKTQYVKMEGSL